jgi:hypothetical protein
MSVTVEGCDPHKLSVTGVVLARRVRRLPKDPSEATERVADSYTALVSKGVEFTPAANTDFFREDRLFAYFEINNPPAAGRLGAEILAKFRVLDSKSGYVADTFEPVDTTTYRRAESPIIAVGRGVMLDHLVPGTYRLQVQASSSDGQNTEWRSAEFMVIAAKPLELGTGASEDKKLIVLPSTPE